MASKANLNSNSDASAAAGARGTDFYQKGNLAEAERAYKQAADLAPNDPLPLSNLSAVHYEKGSYATSVDYIHKALAMLEAGVDDEPRKQALLGRLARCHLYSLNHQGAQEAIKTLSSAETAEALMSAVAEMNKVSRDTPSHRNLVMERLPRYKPYLTAVPEYFPIGHDEAESLFDERLQQAVSARDDVSMLFCGSGDARHVFATISAVFFSQIMSRGQKKCNHIHMTMVDHKPAVVARNLILLDMMHRYVVLKVRKVPNHQDALTVMAYLYTCQIYPPFVQEKLPEHIDVLIPQLNMGVFAVPGVYVAPHSTPAIIRVLNQWKQGLDERYSVSASFNKFRVLFPSKQFIERREPSLTHLYHQFTDHGHTEQLSEYINNKWKLNTTMFDLDFESARTWSDEKYVQLDFLPMVIPEAYHNAFPLSSKKGIMVDMFGESLDNIGLSMMQLTGRLKMEFIVGDMSDVMERLQFNTLEHRTQPPVDSEAHDPRKFPQVYDRIHLSNIPDYIGGHLTTFTYARPLLRQGRSSSLQFNNLLNPPLFRDHAVFQSEYLHMYDDDRIAQHFDLRRIKNNDNAHDGEKERWATMMGVGLTSFMQENYMIWELCPNTPLPYKALLRRPAFEKWLYSLLLKICLPFPRPYTSNRPLHSPLNLTQFLRILVHLSEIGYPAHWLSAILTSACSGTVTTTTRPPSDLVMTPEALDKPNPSQEVVVSPWRAELTTLLSIWYPILPFGFIATPNMLVPLPAITEYSVTFPSFTTPNDNVPHFMLMFCDVDGQAAEEPPKDIRQFLMGISMAVETPAAKQDGIHCFTSFKYNGLDRTASFWMRDDVVERMKQGKWKVYIARTDTWEPATIGLDVFTSVKKLRPWLEE